MTETPRATPDRRALAFNVKAVVRATGLSPDTLRAWERRYGLPQPRRSAGRHRLYSQHDVDTLRWLAARQSEGMTIGRAVDLWRQLVARGRDPLAAEGVISAPAAPAAGAPDGLRRAWMAAALAYDERTVEMVLSQAFALYPPETVCTEVLQRGLAAVGEGWYRGEVSVQQEHFASELAVRQLERLVAAAPAPLRPGRILLGCPPEEEHTFGLLLLALMLRWRGWQALFLGANVPAERLGLTVAETRPALAILSAQRLCTASTLLAAARSLQAAGVPVAFGGRAFVVLPTLCARLPGHFLGESLAEAPQVVERLLAGPLGPRPAEAPPEACRQALAHFLQRQPMLEVRVWQELEGRDMSAAHLATANHNLARNLVAALTIGDLGLLDAGVDWMEGLLAHRDIPVEALRAYLATYHLAAREHLDERGRPIVEALARLAERELTISTVPPAPLETRGVQAGE